MQDVYSQEFLYHFKNQPYKKMVKKPNLSGTSKNLSCGDKMSVNLVVKNGVIRDIGYNPNGCVVSSGAMSILAEFVIGKTVKDVKTLKEDDVIKLLHINLTPSRVLCALMGYNAIIDAVKKV